MLHSSARQSASFYKQPRRLSSFEKRVDAVEQRPIILLFTGGTERLTVALVSQVMRTQAPQPDCGRPATTGLSLAVAPIAPFGLSDPYPQLPSVVAPRCVWKAGSGQH